ncbi:MAG: enoyl-CoA hydratase [Gammaproteobacteria bacterium]|nr:enoyl-CoA hydratase [Gammaproteobacteria bacterium]HJL95469.1 enoyl-CoA hydratase-related protein [SAR86 cluster bacterium]|tara:strand:+ start:2175 stop:2963 length:789 start_codon:yes stop_codon:yes gene_type:complete
MTKNLSLEGLVFQATKINVEENVLTITLNRPEKKNALNNVMMNEICYALAYAKQERNVRVVVIAAEGDVFCAGADLRREKAESNVPKIEGSDDISLLIRHLYKPVICKIQGSVHAGALLMVTNCTHAIAVEDAKFSAPEILRGVWPHMVMAGLFRVMPKRAALDFCMRGQAIDATKAEEWGLINQSVPNNKLDEVVVNLASDLANLAPGTMQFGLEAYVKQDDLNFDEALPYLAKKSAETFAGPDAKEGIAAFLEKREPNWD